MSGLSKDEARRLALFAQGFYDKAPARRSLARILDRINVFQIDSVNVLIRSHYLPLFSRVGSYPRKLLQDAAWGAKSKRTLFEYWAHEASLIPLSLRPLLIWRMERARRGKGMWGHVTDIRSKRAFVESVRRRIESDGPAAASSFESGRGTGSWWGRSEVKVALEYLFWAGVLTAKTRTSGFERVYDLPERVFPAGVLEAPVPPTDEAHRRLVLLAMRALGVATQADLRDYFRLDLLDARRALRELVEQGAIVATTVEGWKGPAYVLADTRIPRRESHRSALLSPFDSLIWNRDRAHRLFDFHYRIEIYTPAHKRIHGYYVLPVLHGGQLVGRVDLKADRQRGVLQVKGEHYEPRASKSEAREVVGERLEGLADWLGLAGVERNA